MCHLRLSKTVQTDAKNCTNYPGWWPLRLFKSYGRCHGFFFPPSQYPITDLQNVATTFDFIVVGGGTAGNVVANRLSENGTFSVLVLEAGGSNTGILDLSAPLLCILATPFTAQDWNYTTVPQAALNNRVIPYPRGFVLGGSSSVNYMAYTRGSKEDFDRVANDVDDQRWSWDALLPYWKKTERFTPPADNHNTTGQFDPAVHGFNGINSVTLSGFPTEIDSKVIGTTSLEGEFPFNLDMNSGYPLGIGYTQMTVLNGSRSSSATSYLAPNFIARSNLQILLHARVTRILPTATNDFRTVEFRDARGQIFNLTATKEVILSAGSVNSPTILMHSGIGNSTLLSSLGITPLHNLPSVGKNLSDHPLFPVTWTVNSTNGTFDPIFQNTDVFTQVLTQWTNTKTGRVGAEPITQLGWLRVPDNSSIFQTFPDPSAGPNTAHFELLFTNGFVGFQATPPTGSYLDIAVAVVSTASRGSITISGNDPLAPPLIDPNFFDSEIDMFFMRSAVRSAFRFAAAQPFAGYITAPWPPNGLSSASTDDEVDAFVRAGAGTIFHPVGTAGMSPVGADYGVVDPDLRVKGLNGLRIVDLSVLPRIPAAHTQASAYVIGERAADMIKDSW
ncbi:aryl-alcohol-oxidase from pleurotus Eryingii [Mycena amicta]|nr:aryl-alcohol-oxidase from pleurotus Eryingii [Mycena amicta]